MSLSKLEHLRALATEYEKYAARRNPPNADIFVLHLKDLVGVGELVDRSPRDDPEAAALHAGLILDALTRLAGFVMLLSARGASPLPDEPKAP